MIGGDPTSGTPTEDEGASFTVLQLHSGWPGATIQTKTVMRLPADSALQTLHSCDWWGPQRSDSTDHQVMAYASYMHHFMRQKCLFKPGLCWALFTQSSFGNVSDAKIWNRPKKGKLCRSILHYLAGKSIKIFIKSALCEQGLKVHSILVRVSDTYFSQVVDEAYL